MACARATAAWIGSRQICPSSTWTMKFPPSCIPSSDLTLAGMTSRPLEAMATRWIMTLDSIVACFHHMSRWNKVSIACPSSGGPEKVVDAIAHGVDIDGHESGKRQPPGANRAAPASGRRQHVDHPARNQVLGLRAIRLHVRRNGMGVEVVGALPLLQHHERVGAEPGLEASHTLGIHRRAVFDAAGLGMHRRHIGAERLQDFLALAGLGGDDGDDVDHFSLLIGHWSTLARARRMMPQDEAGAKGGGRYAIRSAAPRPISKLNRRSLPSRNTRPPRGNSRLIAG